MADEEVVQEIVFVDESSVSKAMDIRPDVSIAALKTVLSQYENGAAIATAFEQALSPFEKDVTNWFFLGDTYAAMKEQYGEESQEAAVFKATVEAGVEQE
jgi:hypothetical protein